MVLHKDTIKADGYLSRLQHFWLDTVAPLAAILESAEAGELTFSHSDCPVFDGECAPANSSEEAKEADTEVESFF